MARFAPYMDLVLAEACGAVVCGEVPVGVVIVDPVTGVVLVWAGNRTCELADSTAHAEMLVICVACAALGLEWLTGLDLYVTLEPCAMCVAAIVVVRLGWLVYGAADLKLGGVEYGARVFVYPQAYYRLEVVAGVAEGEAAGLLCAFFAGWC